MNTIDLIRQIAQNANGSQKVLNDRMTDEVMPLVTEALNSSCKEIGYDGITYNRPSNEYPPFFYSVIYEIIRKTVLAYIEKNHPEAWFKPMYFSYSEQEKMGMFNTK